MTEQLSLFRLRGRPNVPNPVQDNSKTLAAYKERRRMGLCVTRSCSNTARGALCFQCKLRRQRNKEIRNAM